MAKDRNLEVPFAVGASASSEQADQPAEDPVNPAQSIRAFWRRRRTSTTMQVTGRIEFLYPTGCGYDVRAGSTPTLLLRREQEA